MKARSTKQLLPVILLVTGLVVALLGAEVFLRGFAPQSLTVWVQSPAGVALLQPDRRFRFPPYEHVVETNEFGHRDVRDRATDSDKRRVLILGDSFSEGMQVPGSQTFAQGLERRLTTREPTDVVNAAISGWGTDDELRYFESEGAALRPDIVLCLFTLYNDVSDNSEEEFHRFTPEGVIPRPEALPSGWRYRFHRMKAHIVGRSHLIQLVRQSLTSRDYTGEGQSLREHWADLVRVDTTEEVEEGWEVTFALMDALADSTQRVGAEFVLVVIPMEFQVDSQVFADFFKESGTSGERFDLDIPQTKLKNWGVNRQVRVLDLRDRFTSETETGRSLYLKSDGHWNADGHEVAADAVSEWLESESLPADLDTTER